MDYFKNNYVQIKTPKTGVNFPDLRPYQDKFLEVLNSDKESIVSLQGRQCCDGNTKVTVNGKETTLKNLFEECKNEQLL